MNMLFINIFIAGFIKFREFPYSGTVRIRIFSSTIVVIKYILNILLNLLSIY